MNEQLEGLCSAIGAPHCVSATEILGRDRAKHVAQARREVWFALRLQGWSFPQIAKAFGRDHTTVMYALGHTRRRAA